MRSVCLLTTLLLVLGVNRAEAITAMSCNNTVELPHIENAIASAASGEEVIIPNGDCTLTKIPVVVNKYVRIRAQNAKQTILRHPGGSVSLFSLVLQASGSVEISGIRFFENSATTSPGHMIQVTGPCSSTRPSVLIHDSDFQVANPGNSAKTIGVYTNGNTIIWNNNFFTPAGGAVNHSAILLSANSCAADWLTASTIGTADTTGYRNTYIEDNFFYDWFTQAIDASENSRSVIRGNVFSSSAISSHGPDSAVPPWGVRQVEVHDNVFSQAPTGNAQIYMDYYAFIRGGTWVLYNNTMPQLAGSHQEIKLIVMAYRRAAAPGNPNYPTSVNCWPNPPGYPIPRQVGYGGTATGPLNTDRTAKDPLYAWNNGTIDVGPFEDTNTCGASGAAQNYTMYLHANDDYYANTQRPSYTAFTYPHPARTGGAPIQAPTVTITSPQANFDTTATTIDLAGTCTDDTGCTGVTWANALTKGSGSASLVGSNWTITSAALNLGINVFTVTGTDGTTPVEATVSIFRDTCGSSLPYTNSFGLQATGTAWPTLGKCFDRYGSGTRMSVASNRATQTTANTFDVEAFTGQVVNADQYIKVKIIDVAYLTKQLRLCVRAEGTVGQNSNLNGVFMQLDATNSDKNVVSTYENGAAFAVLFVPLPPITIVPGATTATMRAVGQTWSVDINDVQIASGTFSGHATGVPGLCPTGLGITVDDLEIGNASPPTTAPAISVVTPTSAGSYDTFDATIAAAGTCTDAVGVTTATYENNRIPGVIAMTFAAPDWSVASIPLVQGSNVLTFRCANAAGNTGTAILTVEQRVHLDVPRSRSLRGIF